MKPSLSRILLFLAILTHAVYGDEGDFLIIENPAALVLYNQYEQRLSESDRAGFPSYSAWRILNENLLLSDQFTHTMKVAYDRQVYFFQVNTQGNLVNIDESGQIERIRGANLLADTIRITESNRLSLQSGFDRLPLAQGTLLQRIFTYKGRIFAGILDSRVSGWVGENATPFWQVYHPDKNELAVEQQIFSRIDKVVESYNLRFEKLFDHLNGQSVTRHAPPQWMADSAPGRLVYRISPAGYQDRFNQAQSYLIRELEDLLHGSDYSLEKDNASIVILKRTR
ncbi:MAG: hypothetical protein E4H13_05440 [Calditrichales bacterium]|nr:MAG: hypothetical protein E4H13_05440 [Calditrichales bacterium]